ncbi:Ecp2 effector protein domain-containing protein [Madurella fahalii]|uniref:Ecp2 effector protein domain-containing protein n=1 Tax=Madurella fahalii TaxID=1157608 RepID=A0ABQ0FWH2_9PEZI
MLYRTTILASAFLANLVLGLDAPIPGYGVEEIQWEVQAFPDGPMMNITGSLEQVRSELIKINPNYDDFVSLKVEHDVDARSLEKRFGPVCGGGGYGWGPAFTDAILTGILYLRGVSGRPTQGPGPGNCGRVSCSENSAIWWCNDNRFTFSLPGFNTIADCAQVLVDACNGSNGAGVLSVVGQNFNGDNWNCIVRGDSC